MNCRICSASDLLEIETKEMMFGTREVFMYEKCQHCGSLQIQKIPENLGKYYPAHYYSYNDNAKVQASKFINSLKGTYAHLYLGTKKGSLFHGLLEQVYKANFLRQFQFPGITFDSKILDVGCGNGAKLQYLHRHGFKNLEGIEPFIDKDLFFENGIRVYKRSVEEHDGTYDVIILNHVFEHVENPGETLIGLSRLLNEQGTLIIAMPVADSYAEKEYGANWIAMDPPRHLHIFSEKGMVDFVEKFGYTIKSVLYNSTEKQFIGSELFKQGIPLISEKNNSGSIFTKSQVKEFRKRAKKLNNRREGDAAAYYLKKLN
ncbi:class I SAM-dependent methyltransferase [Membranihabitans maritimus]|uniref:class I SAM-dependent methyltransferase n=1 Tax=Membranihabitans maritimus TaxID=2904244 RepID=UPI001F184C8C|nr:class I SAM-dependent methyltransferase [Membranihabitans maritimus]